MNRPKLLFLGCNKAQIPYLEVLKDWNFDIICADLNNNAPGRLHCQKFYNVGYEDINKLIRIGEKEGFSSKDKVFTASAQFAHIAAASFAKHFSIPYVDKSVIETCLDKVSFYKLFQKKNIPIPMTWFIDSKELLYSTLSSLSKEDYFYLKSDFSKNPNYVYRFKSSKIPAKKIFWGRDRYLRSKYVLQKEFPGVSLRINLYFDRFNIIDFKSGNITHEHHKKINDFHVIQILRDFVNNIGLQNWLIKFDIILNKVGFVVLDIGMDPPFRMNNIAKSQGINFSEHYLNHYLFNINHYPYSLD